MGRHWVCILNYREINNKFFVYLKMAKTMSEKGMDEAVKQMFIYPTEGHQMSYGEMRSFYG